MYISKISIQNYWYGTTGKIVLRGEAKDQDRTFCFDFNKDGKLNQDEAPKEVTALTTPIIQVIARNLIQIRRGAEKIRLPKSQQKHAFPRAHRRPNNHP
jgi:hypothetical protein